MDKDCPFAAAAAAARALLSKKLAITFNRMNDGGYLLESVIVWGTIGTSVRVRWVGR